MAGSTPVPRWLRAFPVMVLVALILALGAGFEAFASDMGGGAVSCPSYPSCLIDQGHLSAALHVGLAAILGLIMLALVILAVALRRTAPSLILPTLLTFVVLVVMGSLGAGLATGSVSFDLVPVQAAIWLLLIILLGWLLGKSFRLVRRGEASGNSSPKSTTSS